MHVLGISAFYHDSAAALVVDGNIVAAAQEERFSRKKHDAGFPVCAIEYCLTEAGVALADIDFVAFYEKPFVKFERLLETYLAFAPRGYRSFTTAMPLWLKEKLFQKRLLRDELRDLDPAFEAEEKLLFAEHHQSHAASAFYPSPFDEAVILTMDGVGEWATTGWGLGHGGVIDLKEEIHFPHSLGLLYSAFTYYAGFRVNSGEYKVMGLAPYGEPRFAALIREHLIDIKDDGSFRLNLDYFDYCTGLKMTGDRFARLFGEPVRSPEQLLTPFHMDIAASVQQVVEEAVIAMTRPVREQTGARNLCLAGGVALNCVANGKVLRDGQFDGLWVQPAAGDAGGCIGAALAAYHDHLGEPRKTNSGGDAMAGAYLGPHYTQAEIERSLVAAGAKFEPFDDDALIDATVDALVSGYAIGWFQGRMEFGPRALGNRSIIADPRSADVQKSLNLRVKYRESFRPFAPSVLREELADWFEMDCDSPYMLLVADVAEQHRREMTPAESSMFGIDKLNVVRSDIPAVTHVDYSARVQTVHNDTNPRYHQLIKSFKERTGCPILVNTSFNVRGEPIVCTPEDAFRCFMGTDIEVLVIENCFLRKEEQDTTLRIDYSDKFELD